MTVIMIPTRNMDPHTEVARNVPAAVEPDVLMILRSARSAMTTVNTPAILGRITEPGFSALTVPTVLRSV